MEKRPPASPAGHLASIITMDMRRSLLLLLAALGAGCAQPPQRMESPSAGGSTRVRGPLLDPGCLLPDPAAIDASRAGALELQLQVSEAGVPLAVRVLESSGRPSTDAAFERAALACRFRPAVSRNAPVGAPVPIGAPYTLKYAWPAGRSFAGPARCFPPDYPESARRLQY